MTTRRRSRKKARQLGIDAAGHATHDRLANAVWEAVVEPHLDQPTFITHQPTWLTPLCKTDPQRPSRTQRFELFVARMELGNCYTELNDPDLQRSRFQTQAAEAAAAQDAEAGIIPGLIDEDYCTALDHGLPACGGQGIGIDRLTMLFSGHTSIRDVILFPTLRPQHAGPKHHPGGSLTPRPASRARLNPVRGQALVLPEVPLVHGRLPHVSHGQELMPVDELRPSSRMTILHHATFGTGRARPVEPAATPHGVPMRRFLRATLPVLALLTLVSAAASAADANATPGTHETLSVLQLIIIAGPVEFLLIGLSLLCYSLALQYVFTIKRDTLIPDGLADELHNILAEGPTDEAVESARNAVAGDVSMLGNIVAAALDKRDLGYEVMKETAEHVGTAEHNKYMSRVKLALDVLHRPRPRCSDCSVRCSASSARS